MTDDVEAAVAAAFRDEWGQIVATLIGRTGDWDLAEDCAQEAFALALDRWRRNGIPRKPGAWLTTTARHRATDRLRRQGVGVAKLAQIADLARGGPGMTVRPGEPEPGVPDDRLRLRAAHPAPDWATVTPHPRSHLMVIQHEDGCPLGLFDGWLRAAGARITVVRPYAGDPLPAGGSGSADGLIVLGGSMSATDDDRCPWLPATRELLRAAVGEGLPTLGICLGHQLLTVACGGRVEPNPAGKQMGVVPVGYTASADAEHLFGASARQGGVGAVHWNDDIAVTLPAAATLVATAPGGVPQVIRVGEAAWGVQFHPEADERIVTDWARSEGLVTTVEQAALAGIAAAAADLAAAWRPVAIRFADIAADRRTATGR